MAIDTITVLAMMAKTMELKDLNILDSLLSQVVFKTFVALIIQSKKIKKI